MKWQRKKFQLVPQIWEEIKSEDEDDLVQEPRTSNGLKLSFILLLCLIICCFSWTLTAYVVARKGDLSVQDQCPNIPNELRFDCHPEENSNQETCEKRGCCWNVPQGLSVPLNIPYCYYPRNYSLYQYLKSDENEIQESHHYQLTQKSGFPNDISRIKLQVSCFDKSILRLRIVDEAKQRFEVPYTNFENNYQSSENCDLEFVRTDNSALRFQVRRKYGHKVL